jgi:hypothetical protein
MAEILHYQRDRSLADVPGFSVGLQLQLSANTKVYLALGSAEFTLTFSHEEIFSRLHSSVWR